MRALVFVGMFTLSSTALAADLSRPNGNAMGDGLRLSTEPDDPLPATTCPDGDTVFGIDVSYYQGTIDWDAMVASGVEFAFVRVSHSLQFEDPEFDNNLSGARAAGIHTGVYQYFEPDEDPVAQAQLLLDRMGPLQAGDLPPVIDVESAAGQTPAAIANAVAAWLEYVEGALGVTPIIYTGKYFWQDNVGSEEFSAYPLWAAHYTDGCPNIADQWTEWAFHQYCDCGSAGGISPIDVNVWNGDLAALETFAGGGGESTPCGVIEANGATIDNGDACLELHGPMEFWREEATGEGGSLRWTHATEYPDPSNYAVWRLFFAAAGEYRLEVHVPAPWGESKQTSYLVRDSGGETVLPVDQSQQDGWVELGVFDFEAESDYAVRLDDNTGEANDANIQIVVDALRITPIDVEGGSTGEEPPTTTGDPDDESSGSASDPDDDSDPTQPDGTEDDGGDSLASDALPPGLIDTDPGCVCTTSEQTRAPWWLPILVVFFRRRRSSANTLGARPPSGCASATRP